MNSTVEEIRNVVNWYKNKPKDYSNISNLMEARKKLSIHLFNLSVDMSKAKQDQNETEYQRDIERNKVKRKYIDDDYSMNKAEEYARMDTILLIEQEKIADAYYRGLKHIYDATVQVNNTLMQHISWLKGEQEDANIHT